MGSKSKVRAAGILHISSRLAALGWNMEQIAEGQQPLYRIRRGDTSLTLKISALSRRDPIGFSSGLGVLTHIDYLVICNNLQATPNLRVLDPTTIRNRIHKVPEKEHAYWLWRKYYDGHDLGFEHVFGQI